MAESPEQEAKRVWREKLLALWTEFGDQPDDTGATWVGATKDLLFKMGMRADDKGDGYTFEPWPYGPPGFHEAVCLLHKGGRYCDCKASDASDDDFGTSA
jgi:hypothetical protein